MNYKIKRLSGTEVHNDKSLLQAVLRLDEVNMTSIMEDCGYTEFPWDKRILGLNRDATQFFACFKDEELVGYLEVGPDWNDSDVLYLSSIQISPRYLNTGVFKALIHSTISTLKEQQVDELTSNVQVSNHKMINIFKKLGFEVFERDSGHTLNVRGNFDKITSSPLVSRLFRA